MSHNGNNCLCFESFLQKRKDTLKLRWVTYWFRLQNTTLFFYTQKHGHASHLRGHYYIYTMQSVREVQNDDHKRFMFEIIMTSGKRKMLAADTAALRKDWVRNLWQAMHLSTSGASVAVHSTNCEASKQQSAHSNVYSDVECVVKNSDSCGPPIHEISSEEPIYQNTAFQPSKSADTEGPKEVEEEVAQEGLYDVLPSRRDLQGAESSSDIDNGVYDSPISYRRPADEESPYDVPSALLRKLPDTSLDPTDDLYWKI